MWWLGSEAPMPWPLRDEPVQEWLGGEAVEALAGPSPAAHRRALRAGSPRPPAAGDERFFAEKSNLRVSSVAGELYPHGRELFLVRDFRDMVCSMFAFNAKRGVTRLRARGGGQRHGVRGVARRLGRLAHARMGAPPRPRAPGPLRGARAGPGARAGRPARIPGRRLRAETIQGMLDRLSEEMPELREHPTSDVGPGLDRALAHRPRPGAERGLRAGVRARRWSCSATSAHSMRRPRPPASVTRPSLPAETSL